MDMSNQEPPIDHRSLLRPAYLASLFRPPPELRGSAEYRRRSVARGIIAAVGLVSLAASVVLGLAVLLYWVDRVADYEGRSVPLALWLPAALAPVITGVLALVWHGLHASAVRDFEERREQERKEALRAARDEALPAAEAELTRLVTANRALLDEYQRPVRAQARTSYTFAQGAIFVGLLVLVGGVIITLTANDPSARLSVAGLTAVGAALSGYIARTYLRVYERAQHQLNFYFREPLITSYLLNAERLAEKLPPGEGRNRAHMEMVLQIVHGLGGVGDELLPKTAAPESPAMANRVRPAGEPNSLPLSREPAQSN
jgi:MFS family permease